MSIKTNWIDGETLSSVDMKDTFDNVATSADTINGTVGVNGTLSFPIGSVMAWMKSFTNTPVLTPGWVQCDGQVISDAASPYNGVTIPNLNSTNYFLRGNATSGTTGGATSHRHYMYTGWRGDTGGSNYGCPVVPAYTGYGGNEPPYYNIVWIMRIK